MMPASHRSDRYGIITTLLIVIGVSIIEVLGGFQSLDDVYFDGWQQFGTAPSRRQILVVEADPGLFQPQRLGDLHQLVVDLGQLGAAGILIAEPVGHPESLRQAVDLPLVVASGDRTAGVMGVRLPGSDQPIYRRFCLTASSTNLERRLALLVSGRFEDAVPRDARIRFCENLPTIQHSAVADGELVPELVAGRAVIVGIADAPSKTYFGPRADSRQLGELELRAQILRSLIASDWTTSCSDVYAILLVLSIATVATQLFRNIAPVWWFTTLFCLLGGSVILSWMVVDEFAIELPITAIATACFTASFLVAKDRLDILRHIIQQRGAQYSDFAGAMGVSAQSNRRREDPWETVASAWDAFFAPTRMVFLELQTGETHLTVRKRRSVSDDEIIECRRDVTRLPFRDAVDFKRVVRLSPADFFQTACDPLVPDDSDPIASKPADGGLAQFVVPLVADRTMGVIAIEIDASRLQFWSDFETQALTLAHESAAFLSDETSRDPARRGGRTPFSRFMELPEQATATEIASEIAAARMAAEIRCRTLQSSTIATAVCDAFGRMVYVNDSMYRAMSRRGCSADESDAIAWLHKICGKRPIDCGNLLRNVILQGKSETIHCRSQNGQDDAALVVTCVEGDDFQAAGIENRLVSLELLETAEAVDAADWEAAFVQQRQNQLESHVRSCISEASTRDSNSAAETSSLISQLDELLTLCNTRSTSSLSESPQRWMAIAPRRVFSRPLSEMRHAIEEQGFGVSIGEFAGLPLVRMNPFFLHRMLRTQWDCVAMNCSAGDELQYTFHPTEDHVLCCLKPGREPSNDTKELVFREFDDDVLTMFPDSTRDDIGQSRDWLQGWGGELRIGFDDEHGIVFTISLCIDRAEVSDADSPGTLVRRTT